MASAMASAAARNVHPPYTIPVGPRIRPPRLLPGTKAANTDPQPEEEPPNAGLVWVQGKWRNPGSNAAKNQREVQSKKVEKALRHATHGMNIYAYSHIRTNQVVYSLTKVMQNNKILSQLLFHGKQTVPSSLRRDVWRPYFSIHFSKTPAGALAGLKAYRRLRELSMIHQLSPDPESLITTAADVEKAKAKYTPEILERKLENETAKNIPVEDQLLPKKLRARKLMDQKASSVADAAWVLGHVNSEWNDSKSSPAELLDAIVAKRISKHENWSSRALRRLNNIRQKEELQKAQIEARQKLIELERGRLGFTHYAAKRIALEHSGTVFAPQKGAEYGVGSLEALETQRKTTAEYEKFATGPGVALLEEQNPAEFNTQEYRSNYVKEWKKQNGDNAEGPSHEEIEAAITQEQERRQTQVVEYEDKVTKSKSTFAEEQKNFNDASKTVTILWADMRDGTWAEEWPENVRHGELKLRATMNHGESSSKQKATIDGEGNEIPYGPRKITKQSSTPHVFGDSNLSGLNEKPGKSNKASQEWRATMLTKWKDSKVETAKKVSKSLETLFERERKLTTKKAQLQLEFDALQRAEATSGSSLLTRRLDSTDMDNMIQNLTEGEKRNVKTSMAAMEDELVTNKKALLELETNYQSIFPDLIEFAEWKKGLFLYTELLRSQGKIQEFNDANGVGGASQPKPPSSRELQRIDSMLSMYEDEKRVPTLRQIKNLEVDLQARTAHHRRRIAEFKQQISALNTDGPGATTKSRLEEIKSVINDEKDLLLKDREDTLASRENIISEALNRLSHPEEGYEGDVIDLLNQRYHLECEANEPNVQETEQVPSYTEDRFKVIDDKLRTAEDNKMRELLGIETLDVELNIQEYNEEMRTKGIEAPAPAKKGVFDRIKSLFGR